LVIAVILTNGLTNGNLFLRYQGETAGTLAGSYDKDFNTLTTNRYNIFMADIDLFSQHSFWGVGAGASSFLRIKEKGILSHAEMSRLLAEHGLFGVLFIIIIILVLTGILRSRNDRVYKGFLVAIFIIGFYTSFHAATRTYVTPLLMGLSTISVISINRKPIIQNFEIVN
jgi:hypothetical protein